jgi:putative SOS response-associated peptidase YedK
MINARVETLTTKAAFKTAAARRRCLVPALGYYEWQTRDKEKVPYFLHDSHDALLGLAGLYELWRDPALADDDPNRWLWTCTIITQEATDSMGEIHDRSPIAVPHELRSAWLDCTGDDPHNAQNLLTQMPPLQLEPRVVSKAVGNVKNNGAELIAAVEEEPQRQVLFDV